MYRIVRDSAVSADGKAPFGSSPAWTSARAAIASSIRKVLPFPGTLCATIEPPIVSTRFLERSRPKPVPSTPRRSAPSREKGMKRLPISSGTISSPVSLTVIQKEFSPVGSPEIRTSPPARSNFTAFERRFKNNCFDRWRSART